MLGWVKSKAEPPKPAPEPAPDVVSGFPRGLPDGDRHKPLATAQWVSSAAAHDILGPWEVGRFLIGRDAAGRYAGHIDDRHVLTVSGSRAGKGVSLICPALIFWPGSCIAIDPKGELATITACRRSDQGSEWAVPMGGKVYVLDPFQRVTGPAVHYRAAFNPLADLDPDTDDGLEMAGQIADALVMQIEGPGSHWTQSARSFLRGLILYVAKVEPPASRHLVRVRELVTQGREAFDAMLEHMGKQGGLIARTGQSLAAKPASEKWSVVSTCDVQTDFLEGQSMRRVLSGHDFKLEDLKAKRVTVYLCLPATRLATHGRWLRLMVGLALEAMERTGPIAEGKPPVLFCLDEFAVLGHMESIEKAAGHIAGAGGVKLWPVVQDLTQLKRDYREAWETFMGNAGLLTFFGNTDLTTLDHISKRLGECEVISTVTNVSEGWQRSTGASMPELFAALTGKGAGSVNEGSNASGGRNMNESMNRVPLMHPDEIARHFAREAGNILAFVPHPEIRPVVLHRCAYYGATDDALFGGLFDPVPGRPLPLTKAAARRARDNQHSS
jgi:type IV secretion system protein VirD4